MIIGELYLVKNLFWFLYPTKELAGACSPWSSRASTADIEAKWLREHYKCNVAVVEENTYVVLLEVDKNERLFKLLDSNGNIGWTRCWDFSIYIKSSQSEK